MTGDTVRVGSAIRSARTAAGLTLRELAARTEVSPATLSAIENDRTALTVDRLHRLAAELAPYTSSALLVEGRAAVPATAAPVSAPGSWREFGSLATDPILDAAVRLFVERGYHGATMRAIAAQASLTAAGVYHHHPSKQHLLMRVFEISMDDLTWRVSAAGAEGGDAAERVGSLVECLALFHTYRRDLAFINASEMRSLEPANRRRIIAWRTRVQATLDREIDAGLAAGVLHVADPRDAARAVTTMCTSLPRWFSLTGPAHPEHIAAEYARFALRLLGHDAIRQDLGS